jgi:hypothetical protein
MNEKDRRGYKEKDSNFGRFNSEEVFKIFIMFF